jgi:hypothetical protein
MASGAMIGVCPVCGEIIWEDEEWVMDKYFMKHIECDGKLMNDLACIINKLTRNQQLRVMALLELIIIDE